MTALDSDRAAALRAALGRADDATAALRLVAALNDAADLSASRIGALYGVSERTVYAWLARFDGVPAEPDALLAAARDATRSGRPPKLAPAERERLRCALATAPEDCGFDAESWSPSLLVAYAEREYGVDYSRRHARRLLDTLRGD